MWTHTWIQYIPDAQIKVRPPGESTPKSLKEALLSYWRGNPPEKKTDEKRPPEEAYCENVGFGGTLRKR